MLWYLHVLRIDGDYAVCYREDDANREEILVARALLPDTVEAGTRLKCENFSYSVDE